MPADRQVIGHCHAAERSRVRKILARDGAGVRIAEMELVERAQLDRLGARPDAEHRERGLVDVHDLTGRVVHPESVCHGTEDRVEACGAFGHHLRERFDLALRLDLIRHILNEDRQALCDSRESAANRGDDPIDVNRPADRRAGTMRLAPRWRGWYR